MKTAVRFIWWQFLEYENCPPKMACTDLEKYPTYLWERLLANSNKKIYRKFDFKKTG